MELTTGELERACRGDRAACARLVELYQDRVYAVCCGLVGADAYDCAQDSLIKILASLERFDLTRPVPFGAFAIRIARNACIDHRRSARVRRNSDAVAEPIDHGPRPDAPLVTNERDTRVRVAVLALPDEQRSAIVLRMWGELGYEQIAELEGVPIGTIRSRLARARDALRASLNDEEVSCAI